ncbi:MAG: type II toxin-antitoxin system HicA family toxin [Sulfuricellaceae bacterium]|nr:type II toxin-antitoxin system HicA family toxin [Sulfuricellaceae bacterium]
MLHILAGTSDQNIAFADLCSLLHSLEFDLRVRGRHHVFTRKGVDEILNLQEKQGKAKAYQVRQVREVILKYRLARLNDE